MQFIGSVLLVFLVMFATANSAGFAAISGDKLPPFAKDDPVQELLPILNKDIRERISEKLVNDTVAQNAVKDAPIEVISYRSQVVTDLRSYYVRANVASYFFQIRLYRNGEGESHLQEVDGPLAENAPFVYPL